MNELKRGIRSQIDGQTFERVIDLILKLELPLVLFVARRQEVELVLHLIQIAQH